MTRTEKIETLAERFEENDEASSDYMERKEIFKAGVLAGIRLRDEELLAMEFDLDKARDEANGRCFVQLGKHLSNNDDSLGDTFGQLTEMARWQHEQFMKILKKE